MKKHFLAQQNFYIRKFNPSNINRFKSKLFGTKKKRRLFVGTVLANKNLLTGTPPVDSIYIFDPGNEFFGNKTSLAILFFQFRSSNALFVIWAPELLEC